MLELGLCIHGSQTSSASVSRLRNMTVSSLVGELRRDRGVTFAGSWNRSWFTCSCGIAKMSGMSSLSTVPILTPDRADQDQLAETLRHLARHLGRDPAADRSSRRDRLRRDRAGPAARDRHARCRRHVSSQSGRLDLPKPGCDGAITRRCAAKLPGKALPGIVALAAVQVQQSTPYLRFTTRLEHFEIDVPRSSLLLQSSVTPPLSRIRPPRPVRRASSILSRLRCHRRTRAAQRRLDVHCARRICYSLLPP